MNMRLRSKLPIERISPDQFNTIVAPAELIVADLNGPKVLKLPNGNMIKLFRRKRLLSSAMFAPYAVRFVNNAFRLKELGIPTITPVQILHCAELSIHSVEYQPLQGELLRGLLQESGSDDLFARTAQFIAELHKKGVYFRSLHFENVISSQGQLGLIDIADMKIYPGALSASLRKRNFDHFLRYPADAELISRFGRERFESIYTQALG
jgi:hypothetical protein